MFLRGYGPTLQAVEDALAPYASRLEPRLGAPLRGINRAVLAEKAFHINSTNPSNWEGGSEWLHTETNVYDAALREIVR